MNDRGEHFVQSLERGLAVIRAFGADDPELTLSDVARRTGLTRAAARRFLLTLCDLGYVRTDGKQFALTPRVLDLGYAFLSSLTLPEVAEPHLERLAAELRESSSVSVLDGDEIVYVGRVPTSRIMRVAINVGTRFPAYATSMGRVLLAGLGDDARAAYLARADIRPLTPRAIDNAGRSRPRARPRPRAGLGAGRPGARGGTALDRRPRARRERPDDRRRQRLRPRQPREHGGRAGDAAPTAAGDRRAHRSGPRPRLQSPVMAQTRQAWSEHALERLSDAGYRRGGARQVVIELLDEQPCALSALDIEDELRGREGRRVGRASIYRVLDELVTLGLLSRVEVGDGVARYEPQRPHHENEHHHHLVCDGCGRLEPFQDDALERAIRGLADRVAFDVSDHDVTLHGSCEACRKP